MLENIVYPGDDLSETLERTESNLILGRGLLYRPAENRLTVSQPGILLSKDERVWVECPHQISYFPAIKDKVIGRIVGKTGEFYRVDIGASRYACLDFFEFEGATKRNRPILAIGALVYANIKNCCNFMEPELSCINPTTMKSDGFGELVDGYVIKTRVWFAKSLLNASHPLLKAIGSIIPFEIAIGFNGVLWVKAQTVTNTHVVSRCIIDCEQIGTSEISDFNQFVKKKFSEMQ